jgi:hypothetical protein
MTVKLLIWNQKHDFWACHFIFFIYLEFTEPLTTWAGTYVHDSSKTSPGTLKCVLWIDKFLGHIFTSPFSGLWSGILGKCARNCATPIMWWQAVPRVTNEPITALQWRRQVNPLSNCCVQCPLPCSNYPGSDGTFSSTAFQHLLTSI